MSAKKIKTKAAAVASDEELGRVAYETFWKCRSEENDIIPWAGLTTSTKTHWMRTARAVELAVTKRVLDRFERIKPVKVVKQSQGSTESRLTLIAGSTSRKMVNAPQNSVYVWCNNRLDYPQKLALHLQRPDLIIVSPSWLTHRRVAALVQKSIVLDPDTKLTGEQLAAYGYYLDRLK